HGVGNEQNLLRTKQPLQRLHLVHELVVDMETSGGVHNQNIGSGVDGFTSRLFGEALDCCCVRFSDFAFVQISFNRLRYNFDLLARRERSRHLLADGFLLNVVDELLYNFEVDVSLKQRQADFAERFLNVFFIQDGLTTQRLESSLKFFLKILKHNSDRSF